MRISPLLWLLLLSLLAGWCTSLSLQPLFRRINTRLWGAGRANFLQRTRCYSVPSIKGDVLDSDATTTATITSPRSTPPIIPILDIPLPETNTKRHYNWREFIPRNASLVQFTRWMTTGNLLSGDADTTNLVSDDKLKRNLASLARTLLLLRAYERQFGIPFDAGGPAVRQKVLSDITKDLYNCGAPIWILETVMERVAEGMSGRRGVQYMMLPDRCFIFYPELSASDSSTNQQQPSSTDLFKVRPGFYIDKLGKVEQVAVRLASFASNTKSAERLDPAAFRTPRRDELIEIQARETNAIQERLRTPISAAALSREILGLASSMYGFFFFLNPKFQAALTDNTTNSIGGIDPVQEFWTVSNNTQELFTRLAAAEAANSLEEIQRAEKVLYSPAAVSLFRIFSAAGACAMWFGGSWSDMLASSILSLLVPYVETFRTLATEERFLTEVVASFLVGLVAGLLALQWPDRFCFGSIAVASVMDLMQGFKVVYATVEVMSRHVVAGAGRLLEGILFTGLISYSLKAGLDLAYHLMLGSASSVTHDYSAMLISVHGIDQCFFPLLLPFAAVAWSGLFRPSYVDLPLMAFHGLLAFCLAWAGAPLFVSATAVTLSAGLISRFTGRQALGNTLAGLYALVPGTYMVRALLSSSHSDFLERVLVTAATIGLGSWTGTILCSPTILGKTSGWFSRHQRGKKKHQAMLSF